MGVWSAPGRRSLLRQVAPFGALSLAGLGLSTLAVHLAATWAASRGWGRLPRTAVVEVTNVGTFGTLWVLQYILCDRVLFRDGTGTEHAPGPEAASILRR